MAISYEITFQLMDPIEYKKTAQQARSMGTYKHIKIFYASIITSGADYDAILVQYPVEVIGYANLDCLDETELNVKEPENLDALDAADTVIKTLGASLRVIADVVSKKIVSDNGGFNQPIVLHITDEELKELKLANQTL